MIQIKLQNIINFESYSLHGNSSCSSSFLPSAVVTGLRIRLPQADRQLVGLVYPASDLSSRELKIVSEFYYVIMEVNLTTNMDQ